MDVKDSAGNAFDRFSAIWKRRRRLIVATFAIVVAPSVCAVIALPNVYEATATIVPMGDPLAGAGGSTDEAVLDSVSEQVLSRDRLAALIRQYDLYPASGSNASPPTAVMRKNISVTPRNGIQNGVSQPYAFSISYRGRDPVAVAAVVNSLAASYETVARGMQEQAYTNAAETLKGRLDLLRKKLETQQGLINRYQDKHRGEMPEQQDENLAALQRADSRLRDNDAKQLRLMESRSDLVRKIGDSGQSALPQLQQKLADLRLRYTDQYPEVIDLKQRIARLESGQDSGGKTAARSTPLEKELGQVDSELSSLRREESGLRAQIGAYQHNLDEAPLAGQGLKALTQGYSETNDLYASLLTRYEQVRIARGSASQGGATYKVLESALVPTAPSGPGRLRLLAMCLILGIGLSGLVAMLAEKLDTSFHSLDELQAFTSVPVLAAVPNIATPGDKRRKRRRLGTSVLAALFLIGLLGVGASLYTHGNESLAQRFSHNVPSTGT